ncbi:MAG: MFS transporter [Gammaproteobacteria bacterium]|nr:MAG: MFS transporter [Pseudomonadota bacterium]PIE38060.1 MAG: MFS transporter [Gammaproteobacteria bacterium]
MGSPLKNRVFRALFFAQVISLLGTGVATVALALLVYEQYPDRAGFILGTVLSVKMVAYLMVAPVAGAYAHVLPRRAWLAGLNIARAVIVAVLPFVDVLWQLFVLIFLLNVLAAGYTPVYQALLPDVLEDEELYTRGLSLSRFAMEIESLMSPAMAAVFLLAVSYEWLFGFNAVAFALAALSLLLVTLPANRLRERSGGIWRQVTFGMRSYLNTPRLQAALAMNLAMSAAGAMVIVNTVVYVQGRLGLPEENVALLMAATGCGSMISAMLAPRLLNRISDRAMILLGGVLSALPLAFSVTLPGYGLLFPIWFVIGMASSLVLIPTGRLVRKSCNENDRNDYFAANFALTHGMWLLCYFTAGFAGQWAGLGFTFGLMGVVAASATLLAFWLWRDHDSEELWHEHPATTHLHPHVHDEHHQHEHEGWEGPEPHVHPHYHAKHRHRHRFVIDEHHVHWPRHC